MIVSRRLIVVLVMTVTLVACGSAASNTPSPGASASTAGANVGTAGGNLGTPTAQIAATDQLTFSPTTVTAHVGDIVQWSNSGNIPHTVTFDQFTSLSDSILQGGASWQVRFTAPGTYAYRCTFHEGMSGTVVVT